MTHIWSFRSFLPALALLGACDSQSATELEKAAPEHRTSAPSLETPKLTDEKPVDYEGIHNVVAFGPELYSGSVPEGEAGLETLTKLGITTVISVDGAMPDVATAEKLGLRYVHLPIGYNGMTDERAKELARAIRDLPGPIYLHCHHGKHRSAAAAGASAVELGFLTNAEAVARMKVAGTAPNYKGLYACVEQAKVATKADLDAADGSFPTLSRPSGFVDSMIAIDETNDHLKASEKAGWAASKDHPDLVPVAEASRLADLFRNLATAPEATQRGDDFVAHLLATAKLGDDLELALTGAAPDAAVASKRFKALADDCKACHAKHRD